MPLIYCLSCKVPSETKNLHTVTAKNGRKMLKGTCVFCGREKAQFIKGKQKGGQLLEHTGLESIKEMPKRRGQRGGRTILDKLLDSGNLPELHYISPFTGKRHGFTGPGTKLRGPSGRLKPGTDTPHEWSKPVNRVDEEALKHDLAYEKFTKHEDRKRADNEMISALDRIRGDSKAPFSERGDAFIVGGFMKLKRLLGLGKKRKKKIKRVKQ